ncbi:hypothetical protein QJQ45_018484, partial [Haematococcus lacustris]
NKGFSKDHKDKWNLLMRSRVSLPFLRGILSSQDTKQATQPACHPATQSTCLASPRNQERDTHTGGYTAEYILSRERLLCLPGVSAEQLGTLCTAVVGAVFPGADPGRQASATTHRRNHDLLQTYIHEAHTGSRQAGTCAKSKLLVCAHVIAVWLRRSFAVHVQLDGCTIPAHGKVVLYRVTAAVRCFGPSPAAAAGSPSPRPQPCPSPPPALPQPPCPPPPAPLPTPPAPMPTARTPEVQEMPSLTPQLEVKARVVAVRKYSSGWVATEGGMHAFELARHVEQLLDNLLDASTQDAEERFPYIFQHAQGLFVATAPSAHTTAGSLLTAAASAPNHMALEGPQQWAAAKPKLVVLINKHIQALYEYLYEHSQLFFQLPHLLAAMGSSNALYAQKAAEQVLKQRDMRLQEWDVHQQQKQQQQQGGRRQAPSGQQFLPFDPAVFDPYGTLQDFLDDILELAAGQPCSPGLRTHLVEFFGAAPSSNHAVESSLQHTKHGNSAKQGLDAMIGSINNKLDPGALDNIDLADFEARLLTLRKQKRDKETTSADDNREAKAARKTEESACMVDGNAKMVLNVPTQAPLQQLQQAFQQHARGADYSNTSAKEATRFTREQLRAYLLYHKVPPRDQPVGSTLVAGWQKAVQKHIAERGSPTGHGVLP